MTVKAPPKETALFLTTIVLGIGASFSLSLPFCSETINALVKNSLGFSIGSFFLIFPFLMRYGLSISEEDKEIERIKEIRKRKKKQCGKIRFCCAFQGDLDGTNWVIKNQNTFDWEEAVLFIERSSQHEKVSDKLCIGSLPSGHEITLGSNLLDQQPAKWRVMVVCRQGQSLDFPVKIKNTPWFTVTPNNRESHAFLS